ncbi:hypothetical protein [Methanobacterium sp. ACI-7]|uniref:hypothetical protein n=1 Tax=unclassified Methanobacterium TaxID=2627676 RepID=UPI0039C1808D
MRLDLKSIAYLFVSRGFDIYINENDENSLLVSSLICNECGHPWYMDLSECFFCGMINTFTIQCPNCGDFHSITGTTFECKKCGEELIFACANPKCPSNDNDIIFEATLYGKNKDKNKGVFYKGSALSTSMSYCLECGNESNHYETKRVYLQTIKNSENKSNLINLSSIDSYNINALDTTNDIFIIKTVFQGKIYYSTNLMKDLTINNDAIIINDFKDSVIFDLIYSK